MASGYSLSDFEIRLIKAMRTYTRMNLQQILAYFTRPGRDINHRLIAQIAAGHWRSDLSPASVAEMASFLRAMAQTAFPDADTFQRPPQSGGPPFRLHLDWWPVGQGLFASGAIERTASKPLTWIYDCGTSSSQSLVKDAIAQFANRQKAVLGAEVIQLAVLSHFDKDHISGFVDLIGSLPIRTLLLPYVAAWRRILFALDQGVAADDPLFAFFVDPASYLRGVPDADIGEIVFVQSGGPDDIAAPDDGPEAPEDPDGPEPTRELAEPKLKYETSWPPQDAQDDPILQVEENTSVRFLRPGARILAPFYWEFLPYNDAEFAPKATPQFLAEITPLISQLKGDDAKKRKAALASLKKKYEEVFDTPEERNLISLFLYSGPVGRRARLFPLWQSHPTGLDSATSAFSQMHTGDGTLDEDRYPAFATFYARSQRLERATVFQVMHHGAESNWHPGIAAKLSPSTSIFSSNPAHKKYKHPHAPVLRDFWPHFPIQIDKENGFHLVGFVAR
ncbi:hypothetical protein [Caulobacter rhizosphaerae]|jgi:hypothetical protein|uniref:hypothetical protein n=1 Tax=Caulobacter rhizosphaerae TaxID=2010972 RepID=UPI0013D5CBC4|nr:hypothetical protein [Caulobacter rhizosphaerae]GGL29154.1 hypothetical protein GCM10010983_28100 [Caulobacter rhizosphaerae]